MLEHVVKFYAKDRAAWRKWLIKNHTKEQSVWLVYDKKVAGKDRLLSYDDMVEEAICFGWIDSLMRSLSDTQAMQYYSKRKPKGEWSKLNKSRIEKLTKAKLMQPAGFAAISIAKENGSWSKIDASENHELPDDFKKALAKDKMAKKNYEAFPPHWRKALLHKLNDRKTEPARKKQFDHVMMVCRENVSAQEYRRRYVDKKS